MATVTVPEVTPAPRTLADLLERIGEVPPDRVLLQPVPGTATEADVLAAWLSPQRRLCELVHGVLVEKTMRTWEALLAGLILHWFWDYLEEHRLGIALGADGFVGLRPGLVRIPDVCFISRKRLPRQKLSKKAIARVVPDLAVEVLSRGNTKAEIKLKLQEYFQAGVRLVWVINPRKKTAEVYTAVSEVQRLDTRQSLDGGDILPGFTLSLARLFADAESHSEPR
jgi:Uma2 family endonuclease